MKELTNFTNLYSRVTKLWSLQKNDAVFLGDQPDARTCTFLEGVRIAKNWPSQWHSRYPKGYIGFEDGRHLDLAREQIAGAPAYLFPRNPAIMVICRRLEVENRLLRRLAGCTTEELVVIAQLVSEVAGTPASSMVYLHPGWAERTIRERLMALSIRELETLADLLESQSSAQGRMAMLAA